MEGKADIVVEGECGESVRCIDGAIVDGNDVGRKVGFEDLGLYVGAVGICDGLTILGRLVGDFVLGA